MTTPYKTGMLLLLMHSAVIHLIKKEMEAIGR